MLQIGEKTLQIKKGDITNETSDAIVNAANGQLRHGGGVARAIVLKGGPIIDQECRNIIKSQGFIPVGNAVITVAGNLACKYVIHAVGPRMGEGNESEKLKKAVWSALSLAEDNKLSSISIPAISSGIFGFPVDQCADILISTAIEFLTKSKSGLKNIIMCNYEEKTNDIFLNKLNTLKPKNNYVVGD
jgi:O-acetyl-ADP-ribose deacetylase (regulator of RNase III)